MLSVTDTIVTESERGLIGLAFHPDFESNGLFYTHTSEAADGAQALDQCRGEMPDAVLLDWNMPVMNGIDFLRALRREPGGEKPVVVFCTTENDMSHIAEAIRSGANEYIMKPFDSDILKSKFVQVGLM